MCLDNTVLVGYRLFFDCPRTQSHPHWDDLADSSELLAFVHLVVDANLAEVLCQLLLQAKIKYF